MAEKVTETESRALKPRQTAAISVLLSGGNVSQVAGQVGCSERQLWRWMRQPEFKAALAEAQSSALTTAGAALIGLCLLAADAIEEVLLDEKATPGAKLRAAAIVLESAHSWHMAGVLEARVTELEKRIGGKA